MKDLQPCSVEMVDFLHDFCRNANVLGVDRIGIKDGRVGGTHEFRLAVMTDAPDFLPFSEAGIVRVGELYKRLRYFKESAKGDISVFYQNIDSGREASKMRFTASNLSVDFRFARLAAVGNNNIYNIREPFNNKFTLLAEDRKEILKGLKAMDVDIIEFRAEGGTIIAEGTDVLGDKWKYTLSNSDGSVSDFSRKFYAVDFRKLVQHFPNNDDCEIEVSEQNIFRTTDGNNHICIVRQDIR